MSSDSLLNLSAQAVARNLDSVSKFDVLRKNLPDEMIAVVLEYVTASHFIRLCLDSEDFALFVLSLKTLREKLLNVDDIIRENANQQISRFNEKFANGLDNYDMSNLIAQSKAPQYDAFFKIYEKHRGVKSYVHLNDRNEGLFRPVLFEYENQKKQKAEIAVSERPVCSHPLFQI